jgi:hypothetical protein
MGTFPLSIVPFSFESIQAQCVWAPEPVFPIPEVARVLGVRKTSIEQLRWRRPQVKIEPKVLYQLRSTFGPSLTEFGEVRLNLETPGGPQEQVCLTHYGIFLHALFIRTERARQFAIGYPHFVRALCVGQIRPAHFVQPVWLRAFAAPHGSKNLTVLAIGRELGFCRSTVYKKLHRIRVGQISDDGGPLMKKRGRPCLPACV